MDDSRRQHQTLLFTPSPVFDEVDIASRSPVSVQDCVPWLRKNNLTWDAQTYRATPSAAGESRAQSEWIQSGIPCHRAERLTSAVDSPCLEVWNSMKGAEVRMIPLLGATAQYIFPSSQRTYTWQSAYPQQRRRNVCHRCRWARSARGSTTL
jgi:hypothetical protein